ncbi:MAG TPA: hypothetical protein VE261_06975 [Gaiellaceae bacterium]|nr:hypothetical protein [Gaiellaceae bacterium]
MLDAFVVLSGAFSIVATVPLLYLALRSFRDARNLRKLQVEVAQLMVEVHQAQGEIHLEQRSVSTKLDHVVERTKPKRRLPRVRLVLDR